MCALAKCPQGHYEQKASLTSRLYNMYICYHANNVQSEHLFFS